MVEGVREVPPSGAHRRGHHAGGGLRGPGGEPLTAWLLHRDAKGSLNVRSAYLHVVMDSLSSLGVIAAALLVMAFGVDLAGPAAHPGGVPLRPVGVRASAAAVPPHPDAGHPGGGGGGGSLARAQAHRDVRDLHHPHLWTTDGTGRCSFGGPRDPEGTGPGPHRPGVEELSRILREDFAIAHVTLQLEFSRCAGDRCSGMDVIHAHLENPTR